MHLPVGIPNSACSRCPRKRSSGGWNVHGYRGRQLELLAEESAFVSAHCTATRTFCSREASRAISLEESLSPCPLVWDATIRVHLGSSISKPTLATIQNRCLRSSYGFCPPGLPRLPASRPSYRRVGTGSRHLARATRPQRA